MNQPYIKSKKIQEMQSYLTLTVTPKITVGTLAFFLTLLPAIIFEYDFEFSFILASHFLMCLFAIKLTKINNTANRELEITPIFTKIAVAYVSAKLLWDVISLAILRDIGGNQVEIAIASETDGSAVAALLNALQWVMLGIVASSRFTRTFAALVFIQAATGVIYGSHRSPIIFLIIAYIFHRNNKTSPLKLTIILITILTGLTTLNYTRQGLEIESLIEIETFERGIFVANNFYDLWKSDVNIDVIALLARLPMIFVPSAIYPDKGVISFSHIMTYFVYGYEPIADIRPIITFGFPAEAWIYLGYMGFLLTGPAVYLYLQLIKKALTISKFLGYYYSMLFVMTYRSGVDSFLFMTSISYIAVGVVLFANRRFTPNRPLKNPPPPPASAATI